MKMAARSTAARVQAIQNTRATNVYTKPEAGSQINVTF